MATKKTTTKTENVAPGEPPALEQEVHREKGGELSGQTDQPQFGPDIPTAQVYRFLLEADGKDGTRGPVEGYTFEGEDAEKQAQDYIDQHVIDGSYWTLNTGSKAYQLDKDGNPIKD